MSMAQLFREEHEQMQMLTAEYVQKLTKIWTRIFNKEMCKENLRKLVGHAKCFYNDLVEESLHKQSLVENEIQQLYEEADTLRRLLNTEVQLPELSKGNKPLLVTQSEIDKSLTNLREGLRERREEICNLLLEQESLCEELGENPRELLADPLPTAEDINNFRLYLEQLKDLRVQRLNKLSMLRREIKSYLQILEINVSTQTEDRLLHHRQIKLSKETFIALQCMLDNYSEQAKEMREQIDNMRKKLDTLWNRLETSPRTRGKFLCRTEYTQQTYKVFYDELQRCENLIRQNIKIYVCQIREEIFRWWDKLLMADHERKRSSNFTSSCYTDDLLSLHEFELEDLKNFYETNKEIYELFHERKTLWDRMNALEAKASEPGRLNNRGGQLLKEEKERRHIATKLPKIEQQIKDLVKAYEKREHKPFLITGENILEVMETDWEKKRLEKEKLSSARKNAQMQLSKSNIFNTRNMSAISARKTPFTQNSSVIRPPATTTQKRKLNPSEKYIPLAKRSLMQVIGSPSNLVVPVNDSVKKTVKPVLKKKRVISTTITTYKSGRRSSSMKKRHSTRKAVPDVIVTACSAVDCENTYTSFEKDIEPASRSSVIPQKMIITRQKRINEFKPRHNMETELPDPRMLITPSKKKNTNISLRSQMAHSPGCSGTGSSRKLITKNLPIII